MRNNTILKFTVFCLTGIFFLICSCNRSEEARKSILKIYNWGDYIDEQLLEDFPEWYKEQTGEEVKIIYQVFDINEIMLTKIARGQEDFDLVCPSEYIIERMMKKDLLLPISKDFGTTPDYTLNIAPYINEELNKLSYNGKTTTDYAIPYMWGTAGILYNKKFVPEEDVTSWSCLWNPKYKGKILMKDSYRDAYGTALIYAFREQLKNGIITVDSLMNDYSPAAIDTVAIYLKKMKPLLAGWEADFGKEMMTKSRIYLNMTWSGDAVWAIEEAAVVNVDLGYSVPEEGSNIWYDGWVIPRYAKNVKAASYFINYLCRPDNAIRNMDKIGYVSAVATPEIMAHAIDSTLPDFVDASYFFGEEGQHIQVNPAMYPDIQVVERCAMIRDAGDHTEEVLDMWSAVKGDNLNSGILFIIFASFGLLFIFGIYNKYQKFRHRKVIHIRRKRKK